MSYNNASSLVDIKRMVASSSQCNNLVRIKSIQSLRAIAAMSVVVFHALGHARRAGYAVPEPFGAFGVDIFFVISGFVMVLTTQKKTSSLNFMMDRIFRIVPLYWLLTTIKVVQILLVPSLGHLVFTWPHAFASYLFVPWADPNGNYDPVLIIGWTLNYEMFFYAAFACLLLKPNWLAPFFGVVVLLGFADGPSTLKFLTDPMILEFMFGIVIGLVYVGKSWAIPAAVACLSLLFPGDRVVYWGIPSAALVATCVASERWWPRTIVSRIGDSSYSLYLTHVFLLPVFFRLAKLPLPGWTMVIISGSICVAVGHIVYLAIEKPLNRSLRTALRARITAGRVSRTEALT